ncbi:crotonase/enoyl-CoA hydratase family protein [Dyadobacter sp. LHD-138]|uniref:crotonase/enoyl-CoA hydratase family protein n=1 Tax=Dyadobacter sp. LHD-138 TaxID=3071413 RepID=UPI0027DFFD24|nr:crotonase/enoyl-CoA hydratase family protein [Dyadobacter sp. LHD-138]MDQ6477392.1 crotonase/enoyl-CoA hydratase family protein [Dyadobacter sp. LHD-138]
MNYETIFLTIENDIGYVKLNRPEKANALNQTAWHELKSIFEALDENDDVRVIMLSGEGKHFCSGIDLSLLLSVQNIAETCDARKREKLRKLILELQSPINAIENCSKPVIAAIHGGCIGAGVDIVSACDMRYATHEAYFSIKEIDMGMVADLGTLQRLPKLISEGMVREMAFTGRQVFGEEAEKIGLVNKSFESKDVLLEKVAAVAKTIAAKSPVSVRGTKHILNHSRDHSVADGLAYMATWNAAMLLSEDLHKAFQAQSEKRLPNFKS